MPNLTLDEPIEASHAALVPCSDERLREFARHHPALETYLSAFRNEFGTQISSTVGMVRNDAYHNVNSVTAFGGFRDAACVSAIVIGQSLTLNSDSARGILHSDAFDVYPWFPSWKSGFERYVIAFTPAVRGVEEVVTLRPSSTPALGNRSLSSSHIDRSLLRAIIARWERCFATANETAEDRRLFRALEMARAASKTPGGTDASEHDAGRSAALWVSAFEILAHDGRYSDLGRVLFRLGQVQWLKPTLTVQDRVVNTREGPVHTNLAGFIYGHLNKVRNDFLHGNSVTPETLKLEKSSKQVQWFAAPLFRLALTAFLDLRFSETLLDTANDEDRGHIAKRMEFNRPQRLAEDAILKADEAPERTPPAR
jgi:hypothetical protein